MRVGFWTHTKNKNPNKQKNFLPSPTRPKNACLALAPPQKALVWGLLLHKDLLGVRPTGLRPSGGQHSSLERLSLSLLQGPARGP